MNLSALARGIAKTAMIPPGYFTRRRPGDVAILLYHRVGAGGSEVDVTLDAFRRQMEQLAETETVITLDEALEGGRGGVVITFDDGYRDFWDRALPVLEEFHLPAVLFLTTGLVEGAPHSPRGDALTWEQLREASTSGLVTVGAHTHSHPDLSGMSVRDAYDEMAYSKGLIEANLQVRCAHFAYPFSVWGHESQRAARHLFDSAAALSWVTNRRGRIDPYRLGRVPITRSDTDLFFTAKVRGLLDTEALLYRITKRGPWRTSHVHRASAAMTPNGGN